MFITLYSFFVNSLTLQHRIYIKHKHSLVKRVLTIIVDPIEPEYHKIIQWSFTLCVRYETV